ncbi:unnamed protein product [Prunus armeniaca]
MKECAESIYGEEQTASSSTDRDDESCITVDRLSDTNAQSSSRQSPRLPGLQRDKEVLKNIEKAITHMGGFRRIATLMNLSLAYKHRKPKGYWDNIDNLLEEINQFQRSWGTDPSFMPSRKSYERAGRYDIARALEKWGGLHEVSRLLSLKVRHPNRQPNLARDVKLDIN